VPLTERIELASQGLVPAGRRCPPCSRLPTPRKQGIAGRWLLSGAIPEYPNGSNEGAKQPLQGYSIILARMALKSENHYSAPSAARSLL